MFKSFGKKGGKNGMSDEQRKRRADAQAAKARDKIVALTKDLQKANEDNRELLQKYNKVSEEFDELEDKAADLEERVDTLTSELKQANEEKAQACNDKIKAEEDLRFAEAMKSNALGEVEGLEIKLKEALGELEMRAKNESSLEDQLTKQAGEMGKLKDKLRTETHQNSISGGVIEDLKADIEKLKTTIENNCLAKKKEIDINFMREADTCSFMNRIIWGQRDQIQKLRNEADRYLEVKRADHRAEQRQVCRTRIRENVEKLTKQQHELLLLLGDPMHFTKTKSLVSIAQRSEMTHTVIQKNQRTLASVNQASAAIDEFTEAAENGDNDRLLFLLNEVGISINSIDSGGFTALQAASKRNQIGTVKLLIKEGADLEACHDWAPSLAIAASEGFLDVVKLLLAKGAMLHARDVDARTALMCAANKGHPDVVEFLLRPSQDLELQDRDGSTALHLCCNAPGEFEGGVLAKRRAETMHCLVRRGVNVEAADRFGNTALHVCAISDNTSCSKILVGYGADLGAVNRAKQTPADTGRHYKHIKFTKWINGVLRILYERRKSAEREAQQKMWELDQQQMK
jgi:ankyrin repeat protein